jgi:hypothetical protein
MKLRSFLFTLAAGAIALLLIAAITLYWILAQSPLNLLKGGVNTYPQAAVFVPKQAPVLVSLLVNPEKLESLRQLAAPISKRRRSRQEWQELKTNLLAQTGLDYQSDIKPWLGDEVTLAITSLDFDRNKDNGIQPGYLLVTKTKDTEQAKEFLQVAYSERAIASNRDLQFETYKGVNLTYPNSLITKPNSGIWASAVVGDFVLFANHPQVLREAINNAQAVDLNLSHASYYQEAFQTIVEPRIGLAFVNLPAASAWAAKAPMPENPTLEQILTVTLSANLEGLVAQTALIGVKGTPEQTPVLSTPVDALAYVPATSILTAAGVDLEGFWQEIVTGLAPNSPLAQFINQAIASLQEPLGIDLSQDIFSWVRGEYALSLLSNPDNKQLDWLFIAEKTPATEVDLARGSLSSLAIANLDNLAKERGLSVGNFPVDDTQITAWTKLKTATRQDLVSLNAEVKGAHTDTSKYVILASSVEAITQCLASGETAQALALDGNSLLQSKDFERAVTALPLPNNGYFYIDWQDGKSAFEQNIPLLRVIELSAQSLFAHLRSLTLTSQGSENGVRRATVFFNLQA